VLSSGVAATGTISVQCTPGTGYSIALDNGMTGSGPTMRLMTKGAASITYGLYKDSAHSQQWGASGGDIVSGTGNGTSIGSTVYGLVPAQSTPAPGLYQDTVVATITY
jgi:spore coat protein U-like protein